MGEPPFKALQKTGYRLFQGVIVPRKPRTNRSMLVVLVDAGQKMTDSFIEEHSEILDPGPIKKKQKKVIENTAEQRRKKRKQAADYCDDGVYFPRFRNRGGTRGNRRLNSSGKLNSKTFQERMEHIWSTSLGERSKLFSYLDCLWFNLYSQEASRGNVLSWAEKKVDVFSKRYILVPIVMWSHWNLLILCNFGESNQPRCMLLLDSLHNADPERLEPRIRNFVSDIYNIEPQSAKTIPLLVPKVPQQRDGEECGSFILYYINLFLQMAPEEFSPEHSEGYPYFMKKDWFKYEDFDNFCKRLEEDLKTNDVSSSDEDAVEVSSQYFVISE